jgi:Ni,Fe-hydrogenase I small subunit
MSCTIGWRFTWGIHMERARESGTIMAAAGHRAEQALAAVVERKRGAYIAVVEGSIPTGAGGAYCTIGGRAALEIAREVCGGAAATIAVSYQNCPAIGWNQGTNWPIGCGHPCVGCAEPNFWDRMTPFYAHLGGILGFGVHSNIDRIGLGATAGVAAAFTAQGLLKIAQRRAVHGARRHEEPAVPPAGGEGGESSSPRRGSRWW